MSDIKTFLYSVGASIVAGIILMNMDKLSALKPLKKPHKAPLRSKMRPKELQRSHPTASKHPLHQR